MKRTLSIVAFVVALLHQTVAAAYPDTNKRIRFIVGFPAGSTIDNVSRLVLDDISARTGAVIIVDNKPGALGSIGAGEVVRSLPDGYTLMPSSSATHSSGPFLSKAFQQFSAIKDFTHIARIVRFDVAIATSSSSEYKDAKSLLKAASEKPGVINSGYGSGTGRVAAAAFSRAAQIQVQAIPYKGQPAAVVDLIGGRIDFVAADIGALAPQIKSGKLNAVALIAQKRSSILADVPTLNELGIKGVDLTAWIGIAGPAKLPDEVVTWWQDQLKKTINSAKIQNQLRTIGMEPDVSTGKDFNSFVQTQYNTWGEQTKHAGIKPE
ncbi:Bug family tripartite tricarboxylate transporter substrate binding protein [Advenella incenata]